MALSVRRGSIVLIRYPFTDLTGTKLRPAEILTPDALISRIDDLLCLFISSSMPTDLLPSDFVLSASHASFAKTGLKYRSAFRSHKLALLHKALVVRVLGEADTNLMRDLTPKLRLALGL